MHKQLLFAATLILSLFLVAFKWAHQAALPALKYISRSEAMRNKFTMQCSPDWRFLNSDSLVNGITILDGWGDYRWDIESKSDSTRLYFQQGINMYYSFYIIGAMASFKKAARFDENNAMIWWAQALVYGPNINDYASDIPAKAYTAAQKAVAFSPANGTKEKVLIRAMAVRYSTDTAAGRSMLNQLYADKMEEAYQQFPHDADIGALYADALMLQHPWQYWKHDGEAQPWTGPIL